MTTTRPFGMGWLAMVGLALLGIPRALFHDLAPLGPVLNGILVVGPVIVWIIVVLVRRVDQPFACVLLIGCLYGVLLGVVHEATWTTVWGDDPPSLGGNLQGVLPRAAETAVQRGFAFVSSVVTGVVVGAIGGGVAALLMRLRGGSFTGSQRGRSGRDG